MGTILKTFKKASLRLLQPCHQPQVPRKIYGADRVGIVGFNDNGFVIAPPTEPYSASLQMRSRNLHRSVRGSYTNIADGLRKSVSLLRQAPPGALRRIWLLTDGYPNRETDQILPLVRRARQSRININTIGFGNQFDEVLLRRIAGATHNGKFFRVKTLRDLTKALVRGEKGNTEGGPNRHHQRQEYTVLCLDLSGSMVNPMGGQRKIEVVEESVLSLLHFKQKCFS